jgi:long-subunit acyl-CoA synthetase (AMP-forming)
VQFVVAEDTEVHRLCKIAFSYRDLLKDSKEMSGTSIPDNETFTGKNTSLALVLYTSGSTGVPKGK